MKISFPKKSFFSILSLIFIAFYSLFQVLEENSVLGESVETVVPSPSVQEEVLITRVIDGDTVEIEGGQKIRLIGVDAPESVHPQKPVECYAKVASETLKQWLEGKKVVLEKDVSETDRYGRLLRYIWLDGENVNQRLVQEGFAYASSYPPDIKNQEKLQALQEDARVQSKGLWGSCEVKDTKAVNDFLKKTAL